MLLVCEIAIKFDGNRIALPTICDSTDGDHSGGKIREDVASIDNSYDIDGGAVGRMFGDEGSQGRE